MLSWKCGVGIWPNDNSISNISELTILDESVPFIIPTGDITGGPISVNTEKETEQTVYDTCFSVLGNDVNTLYFTADTNENPTNHAYWVSLLTGIFSSIIPSTTIAYPNFWNAIISNSSVVRGECSFYYIYSLKRVIVRGYSSTNTAVYKVDEDGSLTRMDKGTELNGSAGLGMIIVGSKGPFTYFCFFDKSKEANYDNLTNQNNYKMATFDAMFSTGDFYVSFYDDIGSASDAATMAKYLFSDGYIPPDFTNNEDPFNQGGSSETGGGGGDFDNTSVPIEIPNLPSVSAASTGFISLFNPTLAQLNELASYLWSDLFEINGWKKLFADPMDAILGLSILPVPIPTSGPKEVKVGNIGTGKSLNVASTQFVEVDCGSINVNEYWGAYLDYSPYTQCQIYLPYVGTRPISVDEIMGKTVNVKYHVDILTGACCCFIKCGDSVLYTFNGQCSIPIPINSANYTSVINGIISVAASVGSMVATGGASAPLAIPHLASTVANQMKPNIEKSGAISGSGAVLNIQTPYLILTRPRQALPKDQNTFTGYPSFVTVTLGELSGYTEVYNIHLENIPATADEISEIETLLKGGVIF